MDKWKQISDLAYGELPTGEAMKQILETAVEELHTLNCCVNPSDVPQDENRERLTIISQLSLIVAVAAGANARKAVPCHSCRSVAHSVAKDWGTNLGNPADLTKFSHGVAFEWARQRKAFLKASGF